MPLQGSNDHVDQDAASGLGCLDSSPRHGVARCTEVGAVDLAIDVDDPRRADVRAIVDTCLALAQEVTPPGRVDAARHLHEHPPRTAE